MLENVGYQGILYLWLASPGRLLFLGVSLGCFGAVLHLPFSGCRVERVPLTPGDGKSEFVCWFSEDT